MGWINGPVVAKCKECQCVFSWYVENWIFTEEEIVGTCDKCREKTSHDCIDERFIDDTGNGGVVGRKEFRGHKNCSHPNNDTDPCCVRVGYCLDCKWDTTPKTEDNYLSIDVDDIVDDFKKNQIFFEEIEKFRQKHYGHIIRLQYEGSREILQCENCKLSKCIRNETKKMDGTHKKPCDCPQCR